jgi:putative ABC transport system ATP-binding protein
VPPPDAVVGASLGRRFTTASGDVVALDGVDVTVGHGSLVAVAGPSGSGKSTLLMILAAIARPDEGTVSLDGVDITSLNRRGRRRVRRRAVGYVLPQPSMNLVRSRSAASNLRLAARLRSATVDPDAALTQVGLAGRGDARVTELSGGEQQRLAFAVAVVGPPAVLFADEPTASLDRVSSAALLDVMRSLVAQGQTMVVASHDRSVIAAADAVVALERGRRVA